MSEEKDSEPAALLEVSAGIAVITLNRPEKLNAWNADMAAAYQAHLTTCAESSEVRVIVVTGAGRGFCAGGDLSRLKAIAEGQVPSLTASEIANAANGESKKATYDVPFMALAVPKPVVAAVNGPCAGVGFCIALSCDLRIAADSASFTSAFVRRGLIGTPGLPWLLSREIGPSSALDFLLSGRRIFSDEALRIGLIQRVVSQSELAVAVQDYASELATLCSPRSMAHLKAGIYNGLSQTYEEAVSVGQVLIKQSHSWPEFREGVMSFIEKRAPEFPPLDSSFSSTMN